MPLDLPPKDAPKDDSKATETKPKPTSTTALASRLTRVEKLLDLVLDNTYGKNVRPAVPEDDTEENGE